MIGVDFLISNDPAITTVVPRAGCGRTKAPLAAQMNRWFGQNGVVCSFQAFQASDHAMRHGVDGFRQFHVNSEDYGDIGHKAEALAKHVVAEIGKLIVFTPLILPESNVEWAGFVRSGAVWVRHIGHYHIGTDSVIERHDVLVKAMKP